MKNFIRIAIAATVLATPAVAQSPAELTDPQIAHVAYVADEIDVRYGHLALAISDNPDVREFATRMVEDHNAINEQALALLEELGVAPQDNPLSQKLLEDAEAIIDEMSALRGDAFDLRYAENELAYHRAVVDLVGNQFIPNIENAEVKAFFETGLTIFEAHTEHAEMMVESLKAK